ncbi:MAG: nicotinate-nucleotide adenylyltransferase [Gammaproteobacteria bacterium]|nr:MAG: nicotinate-nucleotide adenylyltransferase [Gammaproteobacteria bacterium]
MKPPIGLLGGTFDPVHHGHLRLALEARTNLDLAEVRLVPAAEPPHRETPQAAQHHRRAMLELAIAGVPGLRLDAREIERPGKSYTVDTVASLRAELPDQPLCLLVGRDAFLALHTWRRWRELPELVHIVIVDRPGAAAVIEDRDLAEIYASRRADDPAALHETPAGRIYRAAWPLLDISASRVRELLAAGGDIRYLVPDAVIQYIQQQQLYKGAHEQKTKQD